jgi:hypothetical protein
VNPCDLTTTILTSKSPDSSPTPTPSGPASEAQKPNTIVIKISVKPRRSRAER